MQRLRQDLLDVAAIEAGRFDVDPEAQDARLLGQAGGQHFAPVAGERRVEVVAAVVGRRATTTSHRARAGLRATP